MQAAMGLMQLQVDRSGSVLGTAADVFGGMHIKGTVQKFRHGLWGTKNALARTSTPDLQRQSQTMPKEASKGKPWQLARKSAPQPSVVPSVGSSSAQDECRTSLARVKYVFGLICICWYSVSAERAWLESSLPSVLYASAGTE